MSAGYGGTYNGQTYNSSMTGDVRDAQRTGQQGGYYSGTNQYNNNRQGGYQTNQGGYNNNQRYNNQGGYNTYQGGYQTANNQNSYNYNQNVQYGNYQNGGQNPKPAPNTSGLEESAKSNYFENEPGSSSYRSGPLKR